MRSQSPTVALQHVEIETVFLCRNMPKILRIPLLAEKQIPDQARAHLARAFDEFTFELS